MAQVAGVRFKPAGKIYYFDCADFELDENDWVLVETIRGIEIGYIAIPKREFPDEELILPLRKIIREATPEDLAIEEANRAKEEEAYKICKEKITLHNLQMRLIDVEYTFDAGKIIFYFTAENRVDFRELVKDLAAIFRTRIELRQIGVRDEAKILGGMGICGQPICCHRFLGDFEPVSIKMAKEQSLSLNPSKISGVCGRLMCCLRYEADDYSNAVRIMPGHRGKKATTDTEDSMEEIIDAGREFERDTSDHARNDSGNRGAERKDSASGRKHQGGRGTHSFSSASALPTDSR